MDWLEYRQKAKSWLNRYKFVVLILCIGILLMVQPVKKETGHHAAEATVPDQQPDITEQLSDILAQIKGVGKVHIMLTEAAGAETIYQTDEDRSTTADVNSLRLETVIISSGGNEHGLIRTVTPPVYLGAVIVCQGGDDPSVRLSVTQAVVSLTGIGADRITVLKMK